MENFSLEMIMIRNPTTLNVEEPLSRAAEIFQEKNIRHLPIVDSDGTLAGILSQRDLNRIVSPKRDPDGKYSYDQEELSKHTLKQHLAPEIVALTPKDTLERVLELMARKKLGCMPVVDHHAKVVGIITVPDLLNLFLIFLRSHKKK